MARKWISLAVLGIALSSCSGEAYTENSRRFSGVWLYEFEGSSFVEGASEIPSQRPAYEDADWFEWSDWKELESLMETKLGTEDCYTVQPFLVTFTGRRTHYPFGGAGHLGLWRSKVVVREPISAKRLGPSFCYDR